MVLKSFQLTLFNISQNYLSTIKQYPLSNQENHLNIWEDISTLKWTTKFIKKIATSLVDMLVNIDSFSILPKNKLLLYQKYLLSKLYWHLTVVNLAMTWVIENLDSITIRFMRQWLDLPISATLCGVILPCNHFGLNLQLPSVKFIQCLTVLRNSLRSSKSDNIKSLWKSTSCSMNVQYDSYKNTKQILKAVRQQHTEKLRSQLTSQGFIISFLLEHSMK